MAAKAYLTIDDSPSTRMDDMVDMFEKKGIPALFFCRGDRLQEYTGPAIRAAERGLVLGNHAYSHMRFSDLSVDDMIAEIEQTENLIDQIYAIANVDKPGQYFRFPHLDRGCGSVVVDYDAFDFKIKNQVKAIFTEGLNVISAAKPSAKALEKKEQLQEYLKSAGYSAPFSKVNLDWYQNPECLNAADCLFTFSTADWMLSQRHQGRWRYKTMEDLMDKINYDPWLMKDGNVGIVLAHDQAEIIDTTMELIEFMLRSGLQFLPFDA